MSYKKTFAGVGVVAVLCCPAVGLAVSSQAHAVTRVPVLRWAPCRGAKGFDCAWALVPLDYSDRGGATIRLALIRHRATDPSRRVGTLFFNPGGPAAAKAPFPQTIPFFPASLRERFDIVTWDPRGLGESTPVECFDSQAAESKFLAGVGMQGATFPVGAAQMSRWTRRYAAFGRQCAQRAGNLLRHMSSADSARDLDLLRQAMGVRRLNYLGVSYGTLLGATYANMFPNRVRAMVLDGNINPAAWVSRRQGGFPGAAGAFLPTFLRQRSDEGSRSTLDAFLSLCGRASTARCAFSAGGPVGTRAKFAVLLRRFRVGASPGDHAYADFVSEAIGGLYLTQNWGKLGTALQKMWTSGSDSRAAWSRSLLALSEPAAAGLPEVPSTSATSSTAQYASLGQTDGIVCGESPNPKPAAFPRIDAFAVNRSGPVGAYWTWEVPCATWPATAAAPYDGPWNHRTANPVLVIGTTHDPATPYQNAVAMSRQLARARLLTVDGYGHSALFSPSSCTGRYETRYLIDMILPPPGTKCRGEQPFTENR